jgi:hypothetical protein
MAEKSLEHPWQAGPVELIRYAIFHANKRTDFDQRISFLLLDIGIETLFKTFLQLPEDITGTKIGYGKRKEASEGNFHDVVSGVKAAGQHLLDGIDLNHVLFYHDLRNKLYHQGNGITIPTEKVEAYVKISVELLNRLLKVDVADDVFRPQLERANALEIESLIDEINDLKVTLQKQRKELEKTILYVAENIDPTLALPSFARLLSEWQVEVGNRIGEWITISGLKNEVIEKDDDGMVVPPSEMIDELLNKAPSALRSFRDRYRIKKIFLIRAAQYYETSELLLNLMIIAYKLPGYEGSLFFDLSLILQTNPANPPFYLLEQNDFDTRKVCQQLIADGNKLKQTINEIRSNLEKTLKP